MKHLKKFESWGMFKDDNGKIVKSFDDDISDKELANKGTHITNYCSWSRLKPFIANAAHTNIDNIEGIRIDVNGIEIFLKK